MQEAHARTVRPTAPIDGRLAGAPISWGACEIPGWGVMPSPERVLAEMAELGLRGTELGAVGFLPDDPASIAASSSGTVSSSSAGSCRSCSISPTSTGRSKRPARPRG